MSTIVVAPHPDDELLGAGGTILRQKAEGVDVFWLIITGMKKEQGWPVDKIKKRKEEVKKVSEVLGFKKVFELNFPTTQLEIVPMSELINKISDIFKEVEPREIFVPHPSDIHTDHRYVFDAVASCTKWFRYPSIMRVLAYETLSETDFNLGTNKSFQPNVFINIEPYLQAKLEAMKIYTSEIGSHPFPRSIEAIEALSVLRGASSGFKAAEAFQLLRERS